MTKPKSGFTRNIQVRMPVKIYDSIKKLSARLFLEENREVSLRELYIELLEEALRPGRSGPKNKGQKKIISKVT